VRRSYFKSEREGKRLVRRLVIAVLLILLTVRGSFSRPFLCAAAAKSPPAKEADSIPRNTQIVLHNFLGGVWGGEYELRILPTGKVRFRGHIGLRKDEFESGSITKAEVASLLAAVRAANFFALKKEYPIHPLPTDADLFKLSVTAGRQFKSITWQGTSEDKKSEDEHRLDRLKQTIIDAAGAGPWIQRHCTLDALRT
jgi:hypothetical protein